MEKKNYLNNKELLKEIHKSKISYSWVKDQKYGMYDIIIRDMNELNEETLLQACSNRAKRLSIEKFDKDHKIWEDSDGSKNTKPKLADYTINPDTITNSDIVIRLMTHDHIPLNPKKPNPKTVADAHIRCNFPPFKHFVYINNELVEVVRSHWAGDLDTGSFSLTKGKMTNRLGSMMILLVSRYSMRGNWRGYCVDEITEALTQRGWLSYKDITTDDIILSYKDENMVWSKILSIYEDNYSGKMHSITNKQGLNMLVTPEHKLVTERGLVKVEELLEKDKIILMGNKIETNNTKYSNDLVELIGWIVTEGNYEFTKKEIKAIRIWQNQGVYADRIRNCLTNLNYKFTERSKGKNQCFYIWKESSKQITNILAEKNMNVDFLLSISTEQHELLLNTLIDGDSWRTSSNLKRYTQKNKLHCDYFQMLCAMMGLRTQTHKRSQLAFGKPVEFTNITVFSDLKNKTNCENLNFNGGKQNNKMRVGKGKEFHPNVPTVEYNGTVWCPQTEYGSFVARRNGSVYLTGNSYIDEMRSTALVQLAQIGLYFDESKSLNPFAYYTTSLSNSFTGVLNSEKRTQNIRDDLLQDNGYLPSFTRQLNDEESQQNARKADYDIKLEQEQKDFGING